MITIIHLFRGEKMVEMLEEKSSFDEDRVTQNTFLSSVKSWHKKDGVHCGVEKIYTKEDTGQFGKYTQFTLKMSILDDMPKCRARVIGEDGKVVMTEDNLGNEVEEIEIIDDAQEVTFWLFANHDDENENVLICGGNSALAEFVRPVFISSGELPSDFKGGIKFTEEELVEALDGYECYIKTGINRNGKMYPIAVNL